jgi:23S rRNA (cytidine1920-2'-O)/16S rRNA (cytidine1409-2'-O)-methyltransferase
VSARRRLDAELVRRGLCASRTEAHRLIDEGRVTVGGAPAPKASRMVAAGDAVEGIGPPRRFVGRGGQKLDAALAEFGVDVSGRRVLDAGASTGGFTDCVLQRGAASVVAVDVGYGQLHERLRADPRVDNRERSNVRELDVESIGGPVDVVVGDLSFISLTKVADVLLSAVVDGGDLVLLVKPQFEAGRAEVSKGRGVITDPEVWRRAVDDVVAAFGERGAAKMGEMVSPIHGAEGNTEFLVWLRKAGGRS